MSIAVDRFNQICANCSYWCGERKLQGLFRHVEINDGHAKGNCSCVKGYYNNEVFWNGTCNAFDRHPITK
jgi:hypothetical protein